MMNNYELENKIKELEWKYWNETDQKNDYAQTLSIQLSAYRVIQILRAISEQ